MPSFYLGWAQGLLAAGRDNVQHVYRFTLTDIASSSPSIFSCLPGIRAVRPCFVGAL